MPLDPSIPLQIQPQQNPFQSIQAPIQTAQGLLALKQNQMRLGANQAISQAYQQALNPDGSLDFNKMQTLAAQSGAGAYLPEFMSQLATQRNQQQQYDTSKLEMALKQQHGLNDMINGVLYDPDLGKSDISGKIANQIANAAQSGIIPMDQAIKAMQDLPMGDPKAQLNWVRAHAANSQNGIALIQSLMPQSVPVQTGAGTVLLNRDPLSGASTVGTTVQNALSPAELAAPKTIIGPNGEQRQVTTAEWLAMQGGGGVPNAPSGGSSGGYTGRYSAPGGVGSPGVQTSLGPAEQAALAETGAGSGKQLVSDQNYVNGSAGRMFQLDSALTALQNATTGKGSDAMNSIKSYLQTAGVPGIDANKIASYDEANKYLTQYALNQAQGLGAGTNEKLATTLSGNASTSISNLAAQDVVRATKGLELMKRAQVAAFNASGEKPSEYQSFSSEWNSKVNPGVFVWDQMWQPAKVKYYNSLNDAQRQQFRQQYNAAITNGWISAPAGR